MSEEESESVEKTVYELWQKATLAELVGVARKAFQDLDNILTAEELSDVNNLVADGHDADPFKQVVELLNLLRPTATVVLVGVSPVYEELTFDPWMPTAKLRFSCRTANCLKNDGIDYLGQLVSFSEKQMLHIPNFGKKTLGEVKVVLDALYGARLGMKHPELDALLRQYPLPGYLLRYS